MKRLVFVLAAIGIAGCGSATAPTAGRAFDVFIGREAAVASTPFVVRFDSVIEDSRCPAGAACIQAGRAEVQLAVTHQDGPDDIHLLRLVDRPDSSTGLVEGWFIEFVDLLPRPSLAEPPVPGDRRVRLIIRQALD